MATVRQQQLLTDKLEFINTAVPWSARFNGWGSCAVLGKRTNTRHVGTQSNGYSVQREIVDRAVLSLKDAGVPSFLIE
jgi:hypothetical protein